MVRWYTSGTTGRVWVSSAGLPTNKIEQSDAGWTIVTFMKRQYVAGSFETLEAAKVMYMLLFDGKPRGDDHAQ